jgi:hypothetical protein
MKKIAIAASAMAVLALGACVPGGPDSPEAAYYEFEFALLCSAEKEADVVNKHYLVNEGSTYSPVSAVFQDRLAHNEEYVTGCIFLTFGGRGIRSTEVAEGKYYIEEDMGDDTWSRIPDYYVVERGGKYKIGVGD